MKTLKLFGDRNNHKHPKCKMRECNHPLDPVEYDCGYTTTIDCDECKYNSRGGWKNPEAKCNQPVNIKNIIKS